MKLSYKDETLKELLSPWFIVFIGGIISIGFLGPQLSYIKDYNNFDVTGANKHLCIIDINAIKCDNHTFKYEEEKIGLLSNLNIELNNMKLDENQLVCLEDEIVFSESKWQCYE